MKKTAFLLSAMLLSIVLASCVNNLENEDEVKEAKGKFTEEVDQNEKGLTLNLKVNQDEKIAEYAIKNVGDNDLDLEDNASMVYDYQILDSKNNEVFRESEDEDSQQLIENTTLEPGDKETIDLDLPDLDAGDYTLVAEHSYEDFSEDKIKVEFTID